MQRPQNAHHTRSESASIIQYHSEKIKYKIFNRLFPITCYFYRFDLWKSSWKIRMYFRFSFEKTITTIENHFLFIRISRMKAKFIALLLFNVLHPSYAGFGLNNFFFINHDVSNSHTLMCPGNVCICVHLRVNSLSIKSYCTGEKRKKHIE